MIQTGEPWTDPEFPPNSASILKPDRHFTPELSDLVGSELIEWKRSTEIFDNPKLFSEQRRPLGNVICGLQNDSYLLIVLAAMAEKSKELI